MVLRNNESPSEGDDEWPTHVKREPYLLDVKDTLVDFKKSRLMWQQGSTRTRKMERD